MLLKYASLYSCEQRQLEFGGNVMKIYRLKISDTGNNKVENVYDDLAELLNFVDDLLSFNRKELTHCKFEISCDKMKRKYFENDYVINIRDFESLSDDLICLD